MDSASCSILDALRLNSTVTNYGNKKYRYSYTPRNPFSVLPFSSTFPGIPASTGKFLHFNRFLAFCSTSRSENQSRSLELAILLEVDGVMMDAYHLGNRQAFNVAFQKLGLDCANWSEPVYLDLARKCSGDEERMLNVYFNRIGWPTSLPTNEKGSFIKSVLREKKTALDNFVMSKSLPLRPGVEDFIDDAYNEGIPVVILTAYSKSGDKVAGSIIEKLGHERVSKVKIVGNEEVKQSLYGQLITNKGLYWGVDEELAQEAIKAALAEKQKIAEDVASILKLSVEIDTSSSERKPIGSFWS
ncbi:CBBY-like protein isoform X2 [Juglans microcarpa x Juglans regia]|uniref:CBBY-like protein isoform X2 n=1 Tax=Juglans microcarpa x Juglans regia TaxID=2249226 RepID=UPI001B7E8BE0|nr:CBBY-like protein isoform X2 [Juglans microcarpa x Juglans regia]